MYQFQRETERQRYADRRSEAYAAATKTLGADIVTPFLLKPINSNALKAWRSQWAPLHEGIVEHGEWNWPDLADSYLWRPDSFLLAIWSEAVLCGLAVGRPSDSHERLAVEYIEGSPEHKHPLKGSILAITTVAAEAYAVVLGCHVLRISDPVVAIVPSYVELGFEVVEVGGRVKYCDRRID
jgi:hypothetical protein